MTLQHPITSQPHQDSPKREPDTLIEALRWRYAVKKFDPAKKIPTSVWNALEEALILSPSSYGLQPWKFFVIDDPELRAQLRPAAYGQSQITDASHLVVFAARKDFSAADIDRFVARVAEVRQAPPESLEGFKKMMLGILSRPEAAREGWVARQVYLALGNFLTSAAILGIDACPMEGLDPARFDAILGLAEKGYRTLFVVAAGHRSEDDAYARTPKVRFAKAEVVEHV